MMIISSYALEAAHLIDRLKRLARAGERIDDLNPAQWDAIRYLARANRFSRSPAALADYLASTRGTVSQTLIALESKGYVTREVSRRDRRSIELALTSQGEAALRHDPLLLIAGDIEGAGGEGTGAKLALHAADGHRPQQRACVRSLFHLQAFSR